MSPPAVAPSACADEQPAVAIEKGSPIYDTTTGELIRVRAFLLKSPAAGDETDPTGGSSGGVDWEVAATGRLAMASTDGDDALLVASILADDEPETGAPARRARAHRYAVSRTQEVTLQQDTVVAWPDPLTGHEVAFSFETQSGCRSFWLNVCQWQGIPAHAAILASEGSTTCMLARHQQFEDDEDAEGRDDQELSLDSLLGRLTSSEDVSVAVQRQLAHSLLRHLPEWMDRLGRLDREQGSLQTQVLRGILLLNNAELCRRVILHRDFYNLLGIESAPLFVPVEGMDARLQQSIQDTFRLCHFRETHAPQFVVQSEMDALWVTLSILARQAQMSLMDQLRAGFDPYRHCEGLPAAFLRELVALAVANGVPVDDGLFAPPPSLLHRLLHTPEDGGTALLVTYASVNVDCVRRWLHAEPASMLLLAESLAACATRVQRDMVAHLWHLLTAASASVVVLDRTGDDFLGSFYGEPVLRLLKPLLGTGTSASADGGGRDLARHALQLLCHFLSHHRYRIKYLLMRTFLLQSVLPLLASPCPTLQCAVVRVFKTVVCTKDDFYFRFIVKHALMEPLLDRCFGPGGGAVEGALLDLVHSITAHPREARTLLLHCADYVRSKQTDACDDVWRRTWQALFAAAATEATGSSSSKTHVPDSRQEELARQQAYLEGDSDPSMTDDSAVNAVVINAPLSPNAPPAGGSGASSGASPGFFATASIKRNIAISLLGSRKASASAGSGADDGSPGERNEEKRMRTGE